MINKLNRGIKPIVLVSKEKLSQIFDLSKSTDEKSKDSLPSIKVSLRDGQTYSTAKFEDLFNVPNKNSNPIKKIEISNGSYSGRYISVVIGGYWHSSSGAELTAHGEPEYTQSVAIKFSEILISEKSIFESIVSIRPSYVGIILTTFLFLAWTLFKPGALSYINKAEISSIFFAAYPIAMIFTAIHTWIQSSFIGKSVFLWGEGEIRHQKRTKILIYAFWILPTTILVGIITNKLSL